MDNYTTHKHRKVRPSLACHPRLRVHFVPTSSWLNLVERLFRETITKRIRCGTFRNVAELEQAIHTYIEDHNPAPKPFVWTAQWQELPSTIMRGHETFHRCRIIRHYTSAH